MSELFDDLARALAGASSRRGAIVRVGGLLAGAVLAGLRPGRSEADTVCCDGQNRCCPAGVACCGAGPQGPNCCRPGSTCCNPATGACCSPGQVCCHGACIPAGTACCPPNQQTCGRTKCCPPGQTCCDPRVGLCCPAGQVCLSSGRLPVCGIPCGNANGSLNYCVNGEVCCGSTCCPRGQVCCNGKCQSASLACCPNVCSFVLALPATAGDSSNLSSWLDTGFNLVPGCQVCVQATGTAQSGPGDNTVPAGNGPIPGCTSPSLAPDCNAGFGAVIGVVGTGAPFLIGAARCFTGSGRLYLAYNDAYGAHYNNSGSYQVAIVGPCT